MRYSDQKLGAELLLIVDDRAKLLRALPRKDFYKVVWARNGALHLVVDHQPIVLEAGQCVSFSPNQIVTADTLPEQGWAAFLFNRSFYCIQEHDYEVSCIGLLFYGSATTAAVHLSQKEQVQFEALLTVFVEEIQTPDNIQGEMLRMLVKRLIIKLTRMYKTQVLADEHSTISEGGWLLMRQFHVLVEDHFTQKHQVADYAALLHKSPKTLANVFAQLASPKTPIQVIHERLVLEAKRLLVYSEYSVKEISYKLGFEDATYFSKFFKRQTGISPMQLRPSEKR